MRLTNGLSAIFPRNSTDLRRSTFWITLLALPLATHGVYAQDSGFSPALANMDISELMDMQVSSVSRREESLSRAAASIFVITSDDIRRSGKTSLPEILRLAPNLQVARRDAYEYAITARGFNNQVGNKLLVLIDGRTIYTPLFSSVFWEMQGTSLPDIERIEVISGPGATLWGANAVNGVINIITKNASETRNTLISAATGNFDYGTSVRTGGRVGSRTDWRVFGKVHGWDNTFRQNGTDGIDEFSREQIGFRVDWNGDNQQILVEGDTLKGESQHRGKIGPFDYPPVTVEASNLLARWSRQRDNGSEFKLQAYWTYNERDEYTLFSPTFDIYDLEFQYHFAQDTGAAHHEIVWGASNRYAEDEVDRGFFSIYVPAQREVSWQTLFVQDEISLGDNFRVTPGMKIEWNDYTGKEHLPSLRVAWDVSDSQLLWGGWSRAVRAPSRFDRDIFYPESPPFILAGGPNFDSEVAYVYELGYRAQPSQTISYSMTLFRYEWDKLRSTTPFPIPLNIVNTIEGNSWGIEAWSTWQVFQNWRLSGGFNTIEKNLEYKPGTQGGLSVNSAALQNDPSYQWTLRSGHDFGDKVQLDLYLHRVGALKNQPVPAYTELDLRIGWLPVENLELSITGNNLLHSRHAEFGPALTRNVISRSILFGFRWTL